MNRFILSLVVPLLLVADVSAQVRLTPEQQTQWNEYREAGRVPARDPRTGKRPDWFWRCLDIEVDCDRPSPQSREQGRQRTSQRERSNDYDRYEYDKERAQGDRGSGSDDFTYGVQPRGSGASSPPAPNASSDVRATRDMTNRAVENAARIARGGMTQAERDAARANRSPEVQSTMDFTQRMTQWASEAPKLAERASKGDREAQAELDRRNKVLNRMSGMLQGQIASQSIKNSVRRRELSRQWSDAAQTDRELARYYGRNGEKDKARYYNERAADFENGAKRLRKD